MSATNLPTSRLKTGRPMLFSPKHDYVSRVSSNNTGATKCSILETYHSSVRRALYFVAFSRSQPRDGMIFRPILSAAPLQVSVQNAPRRQRSISTVGPCIWDLICRIIAKLSSVQRVARCRHPACNAPLLPSRNHIRHTQLFDSGRSRSRAVSNYATPP